MNPNQSFDSLLEAYIFKIATLVINSVSPSDQTDIINLVSKASQFSSRHGSSKKKRQSSVNEALTSLPLEQLERQWKKALKKPLTAQRIQVESRNVLLRRLFLLNEQQIESTQTSIERMRCLIEQAESTISITPLQDRLITHYKGIQGKYMAHLAKLKVTQLKQISKLNR